MKKVFFYTLLLAFMAFGTSDDTTVTAKPKRKVAEKKAKRQQRKAKRQQRKAQRMAEKRARHGMRKGRKDRQKRISFDQFIKEDILDNKAPDPKKDNKPTPIVSPIVSPIPTPTPEGLKDTDFKKEENNIINGNEKSIKSGTEDGSGSQISTATETPANEEAKTEEKKGWFSSKKAKVAAGLATTAALAGIAHYTGLDGGYIGSAGQWIASHVPNVLNFSSSTTTPPQPQPGGGNNSTPPQVGINTGIPQQGGVNTGNTQPGGGTPNNVTITTQPEGGTPNNFTVITPPGGGTPNNGTVTPQPGGGDSNTPPPRVDGA